MKPITAHIARVEKRHAGRKLTKDQRAARFQAVAMAVAGRIHRRSSAHPARPGSAGAALRIRVQALRTRAAQVRDRA